MMFTTFLPPLPPPSASLLPSLSQSSLEPIHQQHPHHSQSRRKPANRFNTPLASLSHDERLVASRKLAIAMYGYSWLKPAGCSKTMLGRREEDLEREEVERQLREVDLQERMVIEQEEQERREELQRQAEGGEVEGIRERDLDDDVPEATAETEGEGHEEGNGDTDEEDDAEDDMEGDLDGEIPDADEQERSWVYDTRRESDTQSDDDRSSFGDRHNGSQSNQQQNQQNPRSGHGHFAGHDDPAATEAIVNAMLDEDELGEYEHQNDLDDDVPDMDRDLDADVDIDMDMSADLDERDLDDDVLSADEEPGWEHTDSELEESEMDISLLPPHPNSSSRNPGTTHEEMRRVSGNRMLPPPLPPPSSTSQSRGIQRQQQIQPPQQRHPPPRTAPRRNLRAMMQTPTTDDEVSALINTTGTSTMGTGPVIQPAAADEDGADAQRSPNRRNWLNPAGARRNLFAGFRGGTTANTSSGPSTAFTGHEPTRTGAGQSRNTTTTAGTGVSSGGLFTPSPGPAVAGTGFSDDDDDDAANDREREPEQLRSRTRSGRLLGGLPIGRRGLRRVRDGET